MSFLVFLRNIWVVWDSLYVKEPIFENGKVEFTIFIATWKLQILVENYELGVFKLRK